jgi:hypothetical protein
MNIPNSPPNERFGIRAYFLSFASSTAAITCEDFDP